MAKKNVNPFVCQGYIGPDFFCDRVDETKRMSKTLYNGRNITLISPRRLGKTGLIWHTFHHIKAENKDAVCIYIDIFPTKDQTDLVRMLGTAVMNEAFSQGRLFGRKALNVLGSLRPMLGIDQMTGMPTVTLGLDSARSDMNLKDIFNYLNNMGREVFIAIDEFQQITEYPEKGIEALLRSHIQFLNNVHFVFSGSKQHLMSEMFLSPKRPFFQSTDLMNLNPIGEAAYYDFANHFFEANKGSLDTDVFHNLYQLFDGYTWYIQTILNHLYSKTSRVIGQEQLNQAILSVMESKIPQYETLVQFLTANQFTVLQAIAKAGKVEQPLGKEFAKQYKLPSTSSTKASLDTLVEKELVYRQADGYIVYDRFLDLWLKRL